MVIYYYNKPLPFFMDEICRNCEHYFNDMRFCFLKDGTKESNESCERFQLNPDIRLVSKALYDSIDKVVNELAYKHEYRYILYLVVDMICGIGRREELKKRVKMFLKELE